MSVLFRPHRRGGARALLAAVLSVSTLAATAAADSPRPDPRSERAVGAGAQRVTSGPQKGLYRVRTRKGKVLYTHGADPRTAQDHGTVPFGMGVAPRDPVCSDDYYQHVLYARPAGADDNLAARKAQIVAAIRRMNGVLNAESLESGGKTADYKVRCDGANEIKVDSFVNPNDAGADEGSFDDLVSAAEAAGFENPSTDYTIFYEGNDPTGLACGVGTVYNHDVAGASNANNNPGPAFGVPWASYAVVYDGCWETRTPMHENGHNQGAVQESAPFGTTNLHCYDADRNHDVLCYDDDGIPGGGALLDLCTDRQHFDCNHDDYFDAQTEGGEYLSNHWNIGASYNRFIAFNAQPALSISDVTVTEGDAPVDAVFTVTLDQPADDEVTVAWTTQDDTATAPDDYAPGAGVLTFAPGDISETITVPVAGDTLDEFQERFKVKLSSVTGSGTLADDTGAATIADNDPDVDPDSTVPNLTDNVWTPRQPAGAAKTFQYWKIRVDAPVQKLKVNLDGPDVGDLNLYVRHGAKPIKAVGGWDCRPFTAIADEKCNFTSPAVGYWYIGVYATNSGANKKYSLRARLIPL